MTIKGRDLKILLRSFFFKEGPRNLFFSERARRPLLSVIPLNVSNIQLKTLSKFIRCLLSAALEKSFTMLLKYLQLKMQCTKSILKKKNHNKFVDIFFFYKVMQRKLFIFPIGTQMF